jgi:ABC-type branched-subunit amino acid transport system ATPase component
MLQVEGLFAGYGGRQVVVHDVDLAVAPGQVVALLGPNGAGKTTTLLTLSGELRPYGGSVRVDGADVLGLPTHRRSRSGIVLVSQERNLFPGISVADHLLLASFPVRRRDGAAAVAKRTRDAYTLFPALEAKRSTPAGSLSGGQQQQLAIARALVTGPRFLLLDEPLGLDPLTSQQIMTTMRSLADDGIGILLVEQQAVAALKVADDVVVMQGGTIRARGPVNEFSSDRQLLDLYLGGG